MPKITCIVNNSTSIVAMYRTTGVLPRLREYIADLRVEFVEEVDWRHFVDTDILMVQRPCNPRDVEAIAIAKRVGVPVWVDTDDLDLDIPRGNPRYKLFSQPSVQNTIERCLSMADVITASTPELMNRLSHLNENIVVVPNALNENWFPFEKVHQEPSNMVVWRGGPSHVEDLMEYEGEIAELTFANPETQFIFMGDPYWKILGDCNPENTRHIPGQDVLQYMQMLKEFRPKAMIVPLKDSPFNRCKSNIAWLEASYAGSVVVAPSWTEWLRPGVFNYHYFPDSEDRRWSFAVTVQAAINLSPEVIGEHVKASQDWISKNATLSMTNLARFGVLTRLLKG